MKVQRESLDLIEKRISELKRMLPEVFIDRKVDVDKLREALGEYVETGGERYSFAWAGRTQAIRLRDRRSKATLSPSRKESIDFDKTKNIIIEGENLEALKILQKSYQGKIKMIYIDPPYNTGKDFIYKDDFSDSLRNYLRYTGQITNNGEKTSTNPETSGRYHSNWLSMMYPRLFLARNLLSEDGLIFVSMDDNEVHDLRMIMNEIFGEENFIAQIVWQKRYGRNNDAKLFSISAEYIVCYRKSEELSLLREKRTEQHNVHYSNPDNDRRGSWTSVSYIGQRTREERPNLCYDIMRPKDGQRIGHPVNAWKFSRAKYEEHAKEGRIYWGSDGLAKFPRLKQFLSEVGNEGLVPINLWEFEEVGSGDEGTKEVKELLGKQVFDYPKPVRLIRKMLSLSVITKEDYVLDFFAGSGTTAQAVFEQNAEDGGNRKFILVQLPEPTSEDSIAYKAGYKTIADICKERVRRAIKEIKKKLPSEKPNEKTPDLGFKAFKLSESNYSFWDDASISNEETLVKQIKDSAKGASSADKEALLFELMLHEGLKLDSEIEQTKNDRNNFFKISDDEHVLWMCFDQSIEEDAVEKLALNKDDKLIVLDSALTDTQKVNLTRKSRIETV